MSRCCVSVAVTAVRSRVRAGRVVCNCPNGLRCPAAVAVIVAASTASVPVKHTRYVVAMAMAASAVNTRVQEGSTKGCDSCVANGVVAVGYVDCCACAVNLICGRAPAVAVLVGLHTLRSRGSRRRLRFLPTKRRLSHEKGVRINFSIITIGTCEAT